METGKRASMREGPLAQLFRKTEEDEARRSARSARRQSRPAASRRPSRRARPPASARSTSAPPRPPGVPRSAPAAASRTAIASAA